MRDVISTCPVCEHELAVTRLHCRECGTTLEGEFSVGRFSRLGRDQMRVLESFLRSRGNLKEMERDLGLSYPTVRSRVDALVRSLGLVPLDGRGTDEPATDSPIASERRRILEALARHDIDAEAAAVALRRLTASSTSPAVVETAASATAASSADSTAGNPDTVDDDRDDDDVADPVATVAADEPADEATADTGATVAADELADDTKGHVATNTTADTTDDTTDDTNDPTNPPDATAPEATGDAPTEKE